jgi:aminoglycoside phosphotransferase (APT) family kinase protein
MDAPPTDIESRRSLEAYLRSAGLLPHGDELTDFRVLGGGVSNKAVLVAFPDGRRWVLKQALPQLRVASEWLSDPARIEREAEGMRVLETLAPPGSITPLRHLDLEHYVLAMDAVAEPHATLKSLLLSGEVSLARIEAFASMLATIHRNSWDQRMLLAPRFSERRFFESLRIAPYYDTSAAREPRATAFLADLIDSTRRRALCLVHGDYSPKNVLVRADGRLVLIDHEVVHWGDPAFDVGFALTHLLSKAHHVKTARTKLSQAATAFARGYLRDMDAAAPWVDGLEAESVRHTLGCLLARVDGRSPLEYLGEVERSHQREVVIGLMARPPATLPDLCDEFVRGVESREAREP